MLGLLEQHGFATTLEFRNEGDLIYLLGESRNDLGCSEYLSGICGVQYSPAPYFKIEDELELQETIRMLIREKMIDSAHDVSDGGLFVTLLESAMPHDMGFDISTDENFRKDAFLFGECQSRVVVSIHPDKQNDFIELMLERTIDFNLLGE